ncbi:MAG: hypothetical protein KF708_05595 [Pirellulales bacterium]|nr:hypothetical protein [Pirellulales bacterium]
MVIVYVWRFRMKGGDQKPAAFGHASVQVDTTYMSWWPANPGQVPSGLHPNIYASSPFRNRSLLDDERDEGQRADDIIYINGLDEAAVKDWWASFGLVRDGVELYGPLQSWSTLDRNCSTVAAIALKKGGGDKYADWHKSWNLVWSPEDVARYAHSIRQNIARKQTAKAG